MRQCCRQATLQPQIAARTRPLCGAALRARYNIRRPTTNMYSQRASTATSKSHLGTMPHCILISTTTRCWTYQLPAYRSTSSTYRTGVESWSRCRRPGITAATHMQRQNKQRQGSCARQVRCLRCHRTSRDPRLLLRETSASECSNGIQVILYSYTIRKLKG